MPGARERLDVGDVDRREVAGQLNHHAAAVRQVHH
jgi:hypothetical protein